MILSKDQERQLHNLVQVFLAENAKLNLSAFRTEENCWIGNVLDSVAVLDLFPLPQPLPHRNFPHPSIPSPDGGREERDWKHKMPLSDKVLWHAREMRKQPTKAEEILWEQLRFDQLGVRFRRQHPIDGNILDFYCHNARLAIELDGPIHNTQQEYDANRTKNLEAKYGIRFIRFHNEEILDDLSGVVKRITEALKNSPPPSGEGQGVGENVEKGLGVEVKTNNKKAGQGVGVEELNEGKRLKILDLGTGGGFPLLPLALCLPDCTFTGLDSTQKKIDAVERIIAAMHINNVSLISGRAEVLGKYPAHREQFDVVLCRAVAEINVLLEYAAPFAKTGGAILLWKSLNIDQELQDSLLARAELSCHLQSQNVYELPGNFGKRQILYFKKTAKTPAKYPREVGIPKKQPLL